MQFRKPAGPRPGRFAVAVMVAFAGALSASTAAAATAPSSDTQTKAALTSVATALGLSSYVTSTSFIANGSVAQFTGNQPSVGSPPAGESCYTTPIPPTISLPTQSASYTNGKYLNYQSDLKYLQSSVLFNLCLIAGLIPDLTTFIPTGQINAEQIGTLNWVNSKQATVLKQNIDSRFVLDINFLAIATLTNIPALIANPAAILDLPFSLSGSILTNVNTQTGAGKPLSTANFSLTVTNAQYASGVTPQTVLNALSQQDALTLLKNINATANYSSDMTLANGSTAKLAGLIAMSSDSTTATVDIGLTGATMTLHLAVPVTSLLGLGYAPQVPGMVTN